MMMNDDGEDDDGFTSVRETDDIANALPAPNHFCGVENGGVSPVPLDHSKDVMRLSACGS